MFHFNKRLSAYNYIITTGRFTPRGFLSLNPSLNPSPRASVSVPEDSSLPLVLCNLLQKEFSGARSPVVGGIGPMGFAGGVTLPLSKQSGRRKGEDQDADDG
jgi:hypothetical protein